MEPGVISDNLNEAGFQNIEILSLLSTLLFNKDIYYNGTLDQIMGLDSFWELAGPEERQEVRKRYEKMVKEGKLKAFIQEHERHRREKGQVSLIFAKKQLEGELRRTEPAE
jgi:Ni,Fe-hydrogenase I large subunit